MQECAYRPNALLARIGKTTRTTTTVCSVHGARFSSPTRRRPAPRPRPFRAKYRHRRSTHAPAALLSSATLPHPRQPFPVAGAALVISSRPTSISGTLLRTTPRARLSASSAPRIAPPACAPLTAAISHRARRIQARREHPQRYTTVSLEASPAPRRKHKEHHQRPAQQPQRRLPIPHAAFFASRAPLSSAAHTLCLSDIHHAGIVASPAHDCTPAQKVDLAGRSTLHLRCSCLTVDAVHPQRDEAVAERSRCTHARRRRVARRSKGGVNARTRSPATGGHAARETRPVALSSAARGRFSRFAGNVYPPQMRGSEKLRDYSHSWF
ncbi:hypothetical protein B0H14DRAFT_776881 [Mycena olivaceomarginata]|nr:hypothetical protein B0H14DRAFT_776881 [Mycena olivaceomarginata]